ncbi:hypothetical protein EJC49_13000 [Aquibium carbonis]|uniref:Secreted protein n=1 Tax=Aquibium carbonis TaxID=2495581 RepID=A0A429YWZ0_9HYPH|nr:hypothetical protein [Aquibium carbonis]RST85972.1 hypothetical protein EJC49_13000 [Aquibium carbonis]
MKRIILASVSSIALLGLVACSDSDTTTTQSIQPEVQTTDPTMAPADDTNVIVVPESDGVPADQTTTQSITPNVDAMDDAGTSTGAVPDGSLGTDDFEPTDDVRPVE